MSINAKEVFIEASPIYIAWLVKASVAPNVIMSLLHQYRYLKVAELLFKFSVYSLHQTFHVIQLRKTWISN